MNAMQCRGRITSHTSSHHLPCGLPVQVCDSFFRDRYWVGRTLPSLKTKETPVRVPLSLVTLRVKEIVSLRQNTLRIAYLTDAGNPQYLYCWLPSSDVSSVHLSYSMLPYFCKTLQLVSQYVVHNHTSVKYNQPYKSLDKSKPFDVH